jgi:peptide/nickel transport system substrate-binding protein
MKKIRIVAALAAVAAVAAAAAALPLAATASSHDTARLDTTRATIAAAATQQCTGSPRRGGSVVYARQLATLTLNPIAPRNGNGDGFADTLIYEGLVRPNPAGGAGIVGGVADRWTVSPDGTTYTFYIRPGLKFSNGQPVTAQDVVFSLDRFGNPSINQIMSVVAVAFKSASAINSSTVKVTLRRPTPAWLYDISIFPAFIVPANLVEKEGNAFWQHPVGSGPFEVQSFVSGSHITFARNPYYWDKQLPYLNSVTYDFATDSNTRLLDLTSGQAQLADGITYSQLSSLESNPNIVVQKVPVPAWLSLSLNEEYKPLANVDVRLALSDAINRQLINSAIFKGVGTVPNSVLPGGLLYNAPNSVVPPYTYNVALAKQLLAKSPYPHGFALKLVYPTGFDYYNQLALLIQQELGAIGVKVTLVEEDPSTILAQFNLRNYQASFPFPELSSDISAPDEFASFYADPTNGTHGFYTSWSDPALTQLVHTFTGTTSQSARAKEWPIIQEAFMKQQPALNIIDIPFLNAHQKSICGTEVNGLGADQLQYTWIGGK